MNKWKWFFFLLSSDTFKYLSALSQFQFSSNDQSCVKTKHDFSFVEEKLIHQFFSLFLFVFVCVSQKRKEEIYPNIITIVPFENLGGGDSKSLTLYRSMNLCSQGEWKELEFTKSGAFGFVLYLRCINKKQFHSFVKGNVFGINKII